MSLSNTRDGEDQTAEDDFQAVFDTYWEEIQGILGEASQLAAEVAAQAPIQLQPSVEERMQSETNNESQQPAKQQPQERNQGSCLEAHETRLPRSSATNVPSAGDDDDLFEGLLGLGATSHQQTDGDQFFLNINEDLQNGAANHPNAEGDDDLRGREENSRNGATGHGETDDGDVKEENGLPTSMTNGDGLQQAQVLHQSNGNIVANGFLETMHALIPSSNNSHNQVAAQASASAVTMNGSVSHVNATAQAPTREPNRRPMKFDMTTAVAHINHIRYMLDPAVRLAAVDYPTPARMAQEVRDLMEAMTDRASAVDVAEGPSVGGRTRIKGPFAYKRYAQDNITTDDDLEAWCWRLYSVVLDLHMIGTRMSEEQMSRVATKRSLAVNLALSFQQRLAAIRDVLRTRKTTWGDVEEGSFRLEILVLCPLATADRKEGNKKNNDSKGAKLSRVAAIDQAERDSEAGTSDVNSTPNAGSNAPTTPITPASTAASKRSRSTDTECNGDAQPRVKRLRLEGNTPAPSTADASPRPRKRSAPADEEAYGTSEQGHPKRRRGLIATRDGRAVLSDGAENSSIAPFQGVAPGLTPVFIPAVRPIDPRLLAQAPRASNVPGPSDHRVNGTTRTGQADFVRSITPPGMPPNMMQRHNDSDTIHAPQAASWTPAGTMTPAAAPTAPLVRNSIDDQVRRFLPDYSPARTNGDLNHGASNT